MIKAIFGSLFLLFCISNVCAQTFSAAKYYQLAAGNEWRYTAPPAWKEGDYVSRMTTGEQLKFDPANPTDKVLTIKHFDATKAAKVLFFKLNKGLYYLREEFAGGDSYAEFDRPVLWFPAKLKIGRETVAETGFTRFYKNGDKTRGTFKIKQKIATLEDVATTAGKFNRCLRVEWETFWELGDGKKARSINVYHYAKNVGVVKAVARFIIINADGKELLNRLVETDLKSAIINKKQLKLKR